MRVGVFSGSLVSVCKAEPNCTTGGSWVQGAGWEECERRHKEEITVAVLEMTGF